MKKYFYLILIVIIIGGAWFYYSSQSSSPAETLITYTNEVYGYSVDHPSDWSVEEGKSRVDTIKDNVYFRPNNFKPGDNWVEVFAGGKYEPRPNCSSTTDETISGLPAKREVCPGGNGGIDTVNYYVTDNQGTPFVISVLYSSSTDPKSDPLVSSIRLNLPTAR